MVILVCCFVSKESIMSCWRNSSIEEGNHSSDSGDIRLFQMKSSYENGYCLVCLDVGYDSEMFWDLFMERSIFMIFSLLINWMTQQFGDDVWMSSFVMGTWHITILGIFQECGSLVLEHSYHRTNCCGYLYMSVVIMCYLTIKLESGY